jgi:hypothetical protein
MVMAGNGETLGPEGRNFSRATASGGRLVGAMQYDSGQELRRWLNFECTQIFFYN